MKLMAKGLDPFEALHRTKKLPWLPKFREASITRDAAIVIIDLTCTECNFTDIYHVCLLNNEIIVCGNCGKEYDRRSQRV